LQHGDPVVGGELVREGEPRDAAADDRDIHALDATGKARPCPGGFRRSSCAPCARAPPGATPTHARARPPPTHPGAAELADPDAPSPHSATPGRREAGARPTHAPRRSRVGGPRRSIAPLRSAPAVGGQAPTVGDGPRRWEAGPRR